MISSFFGAAGFSGAASATGLPASTAFASAGAAALASTAVSAPSATADAGCVACPASVGAGELMMVLDWIRVCGCTLVLERPEDVRTTPGGVFC